MQLDWHDLKINGCPAIMRALKQIEAILTEQEKLLSVAEKQDKLIIAAQLQQEQDIEELQYLLSEEIMASMAHPAELREIFEEQGWPQRRIEREPASVHLPGYPADDGEAQP